MVEHLMPKQTLPEFGEFQDVPVAQATTVAELGQIVREAVTRGHAVYPLGGRTLLGFGYPPSKPGIGVDLRRLDQVIDYPARDMTITVQAGITIAKLQGILAAENQQLPVDVPFPEQATLGGAIAVNASGPRRYGYGTLRDYIIGISFINDKGQEVKAGGRVVKNVAGYDLMKLHIGALGTLGIVTQVTLKVRPRPTAVAQYNFPCSENELQATLNKIHTTQTRPTWVEVLSDGHDRNHTVSVGFENSLETVQWQVRKIGHELNHPQACVTEPGVPTPYAPGEWTTIHEPGQGVQLKVCLLPSRLPTFLPVLRQFEHSMWQASAGNGIVSGCIRDLTLDRARTMLRRLLDAVGPEGNVVVARCPPEWKRELPVWGKPRGDHGLMRRVKAALDPRGIFNPGRFVDGI
jgi:glycolate oxidase FAD binding subunit